MHAPRRDRAGRHARHGRGPRHPVRPLAHARRAAPRCTSTSTPIRTQRHHRAWTRLGLLPPLARHRRVPGPPHRPGPRPRSSPGTWPTATPRSACSSRVASTAACGTGCCTTAPPTRSSRRCRRCRTATSPSCPSTSGRSPSETPQLVAADRPSGTPPRRAPQEGQDEGQGARDGEPRRLRRCPTTGCRSASSSSASGPGWPARSTRCGSSRGRASRRSSCTLVDDTGAITVVFFGRRQHPGRHLGHPPRRRRASWASTAGKMAMLNPAYEIRLDGHV